MLFNSDVFLLLFLPLTILSYLYVVSRFSNHASTVLLIFASTLFYGWWDARLLPLLYSSVFINFLLAKQLQKNKSKLILGLGITINLAIIAVFKYYDFISFNIAFLFEQEFIAQNIVLPLGISFFTFQQIAALVDSYRGDSKPLEVRKYILFVVFFPQLIAGPIVHYRDIAPQFSRFVDKSTLIRNLAVGISIFLVGLFKKVVLADSISPYASGTFSAADAGEAISFAEAWGAALAYTLQIYFDFSAYSDMALGLGRMFNLHLPINFNSPYKAISIIDFWRRWHITLSHFLRDYLYIPLGGNRNGKVLRLANILLVMLLGGLWHGAAWSFVIWGGIHGCYIVINHLWRYSGLTLPRSLATALTFFAVVIAWVFFRAESLDGALLLLHAMSGMQGLVFNGDDKLLSILAVGFLWIWLLPNTAQLFASELPQQVLKTAGVATEASWLKRTGVAWTPHPAAALVLGVCFALVLTYLWKSSEFIYFQF